MEGLQYRKKHKKLIALIILFYSILSKSVTLIASLFLLPSFDFIAQMVAASLMAKLSQGFPFLVCLKVHDRTFGVLQTIRHKQ
jgi:hypothetical protein